MEAIHVRQDNIRRLYFMNSQNSGIKSRVCLVLTARKQNKIGKYEEQDAYRLADGGEQMTVATYQGEKENTYEAGVDANK